MQHLFFERSELGEVVEVLCRHGADANCTDEFGNSVLLRALKVKQIAMANTLVNNGADPTGWHSTFILLPIFL